MEGSSLGLIQGTITTLAWTIIFSYTHIKLRDGRLYNLEQRSMKWPSISYCEQFYTSPAWCMSLDVRKAKTNADERRGKPVRVTGA